MSNFDNSDFCPSYMQLLRFFFNIICKNNRISPKDMMIELLKCYIEVHHRDLANTKIYKRVAKEINPRDELDLFIKKYYFYKMATQDGKKVVKKKILNTSENIGFLFAKSDSKYPK